LKKIFQALDDQKLQQNPKLTAITSDVESHCDKAALSDEDLEQVSAGGDATVPTMEPEVLLGRHARPDNAEENKP